MGERHFDDHVSVAHDAYDISCYPDGVLFGVHYEVTYDWAVIRHFDQFLVLLSDHAETYRHLSIKRDHLFDEQEVSYAVDNKISNSSIGSVKPVDRLAFPSYEDAVKALQRKAGGANVEGVRFSFYVPGKLPRVDGHPYMLGGPVVKDRWRNVCVYGHLNLVTAEAASYEHACSVK